MKRVTLFDYGAGNLHSLAKALAVPGVEVRIETNPITALDTDALVLPGVGAFAPAAQRLAPAISPMRARILDGLPTLGICLGMQLLFDTSEEGVGEGLGVIPGKVRKIRSPRVPHIGWNQVDPTDRGRILQPPKIAYFANSYVCDPSAPDSIAAYTTYDDDKFVSMIAIERTVGVQFHPEKSSTDGVAFVQRFVAEALR